LKQTPETEGQKFANELKRNLSRKMSRIAFF